MAVKFTCEIPISGIKQGVKGQYPFLIESYIGKRGYTWDKKAKYGIIDNGYFEQVALGIKAKNVLPTWRCGFWRVIPETGGNYKSLIYKWLSNKTIFVPHSATLQDALEECRYLVKMAKKHKFEVMIGVTYDCEWFGKNKWKRMYRRYKFLNAIFNDPDLHGTKVHLLGTNSLLELAVCSSVPNVVSCDTSLPITAAIQGKKVSLFKKYPQFKGFIDYKMTPEQCKLAQENINTCIGVIGSTTR